MKKFLVRVQLTKETLENYKILRNHLVKAGLTKNIKDKNGVEYVLQTGEYIAETKKDIMYVLEFVKDILRSIKDSKASIFVTEMVPKGAAWVNLPYAK